MPTMRQRLTNFLLGDEKRRLEATTRALWEAYQDGPYHLPPAELVRQLQEYDSAVLEDLVYQLQWEKIGAIGYGDGDTDAERRRQVQESERLWKYSPLAWWAVQVWTNFGFGDKVDITCEDERANDVFQAMWNNCQVFADDRIQEMSNCALVRGNVFLHVYESTLDGTVKFTLAKNDEFTEIITDPNDASRALFYKRQWTTRNGAQQTLYYPDWTVIDDERALSLAELPRDAQRADKPNALVADMGDGRAATLAYIFHIAHNRKSFGSLWGWPLLGISAPFNRAHKQFMENRLTVSAQKASFVREFITAGGSRAVDAVKSRLASTLSQTNYIDTNPPSVGGNLVHNKAVEHKDMPMTTGAGDAKTDNDMFAWMALIGAGLFPTSAGLDTSRWATALAMDKTQAMQWARYQTFWAAQFRRIVEITLRAYERGNRIQFDSYNATVSIDSLNLVDFPDIVDSLSQLFSSALTPLVDNGTIPIDAARAIAAQAWRLAFQALGVSGYADMTSDEAFGVGAAGAEAGEAIRAAMLKVRRGEITEAQFGEYLLGLLKD